MATVTAKLSNTDDVLKNLGETSFTVAFWLNPFDGGTAFILTQARGWKVILNANKTLTFTILNSVSPSETSVTTTDLVVTNDWNFVVARYDAENLLITISLNGVGVSDSFVDSIDTSNSFYVDAFQLGETV